MREETEEASAWQPIESAPRDGFPFLGWCFAEYVICWWVSGKNGEGWTVGWETASGYDVGWTFVHPTLWAPLPPAPEPRP